MSTVKRTAKLVEGQDPDGPTTREKRFQIRFHNHEFKQLTDAFNNQEKFQNLAQMIRETMLTITEPVEVVKSRQKIFDEMLKTQHSIRRIGVNINQIARAVNTGEPVEKFTQQIQEAHQKLATLNASLLKKVYGNVK